MIFHRFTIYILLLIVLVNTPYILPQRNDHFAKIWRTNQFIYVEIFPENWTFVVFLSETAAMHSHIYIYTENIIESCPESLQKAYKLHQGADYSHLGPIIYMCVPSSEILYNVAVHVKKPTIYWLPKSSHVIDAVNYLGQRGLLMGSETEKASI
jgi:hypothetical protein